MEDQYWQNRANTDSFYADKLYHQNLVVVIEAQEMNLVSILKPSIQKDGNKWCVLYGPNIMEGVVGFGDTPMLAIYDFNKSFHRN